MKKLFLLILLLPVFSFQSSFNEEDVFFGDSITFGNELGPLQYTARWSKQYCNSVPTDEINEARSGASMTPALANRPVFNINDVPAYQSSFRHIFISYWVNDYLYGGTTAAFAAATTAAVDGILAKGWPAAKIVLCFNYLPESGANWPYLTDAIARQWLAALRSVQQARGTSFLDFYTLIYNRPDKASYAGDGIHPTAAWNTIMKQYAQTNIEGPSVPLPVSFTNFSAQRQGAANLLKWTVAQEQDVLRYEINRSLDGSNWTSAGEVTSLGNTASQRSYSFSDNSPIGGKQWYRLRVVDKNGAMRFSNTVVVTATKTTQLSLGGIFPNPAASKLNLAVNAPAKEILNVTVLDAAGRAVRAQREAVEAGSNALDVNLTGVRAGMYFVRLTSESDHATVTGRFVKE